MTLGHRPRSYEVKCEKGLQKKYKDKHNSFFSYEQSFGRGKALIKCNIKDKSSLVQC